MTKEELQTEIQRERSYRGEIMGLLALVLFFTAGGYAWGRFSLRNGYEFHTTAPGIIWRVNLATGEAAWAAPGDRNETWHTISGNPYSEKTP